MRKQRLTMRKAPASVRGGGFSLFTALLTYLIFCTDFKHFLFPH